MNAVFRWVFACGVLLAAGVSASVVSTPALAYTQEQQQACTPDAMRLCGNYIPDVDRITACMIARKSQLSPDCRRFFRAGPGPSARVGQPRKSVKKTRAAAN
jgi:hypothetical protein